MIREIIAICFLVSGMFVFFVSVLGLFRFKYVMDRIHASAMGDTLGSLLVIVGLMILGIDFYHLIKYLLVIAFLWLTSPVAGYLITRVEVLTNEKFEEKVRGK